jgi:thiol:disulfide interchange protein DsbD
MTTRFDRFLRCGLGGIVALLLSLMAAPAAAWFEVPERARDEGAVHEGEPRVQTELLTDVEQVAPGESIRVAVAFSMDGGWHIYWENPGDAGVPTDIEWQAEDVEFGPLKWSAPELFTESDSMTVFGYDGRIVLFSEATVADDARESIELTARVDYLACDNACMPGEARLERTIPVEEETKPADSEVLSALDTYNARVPRPASEYGLDVEVAYSQTPLRPGDTVEAALAIEACGEAEDTCAGWEPVWQSRTHAFVTDDVSRAEVDVEDVREHPEATTGWIYRLSGEMRRANSSSKDVLSGVLRFRNGDGTTVPVYIEEPLPYAGTGADVRPRDPPLLDVSTASVASAGGSEGEGSTSSTGSPLGLGWALAMAFLGGAILNLMPCVFPVLALKVSSFNRVVRESPQSILSHGAAYTAGIVGSLLSLGLVVVGLRMAGHQVGWGFQFQHPAFPAVLSVVVVLFAMNLFGVFDVGVEAGGLSQSTQEASGLKRSVGEGILAVVLATPCSAPFLGTAVGFAFAGNAFTILAIFATLGLGLAAPFVLLTLMPGWADLLPKPGDWMTHLKHVLGFALTGTAVWLLWIVGRQAGVDAMARVLGLLIVAGLVAWTYGRVQNSDSSLRKWGMTGLAVAVLVGAGTWVFPLDTGDAKTTKPSADGRDTSSAIDWEPWSREAIQRHLEAGRPVFVDFTADWCLTCKVNEENAITAPSVLEAVDRHDVAMLKADWTDGSERIRKELARHGKAGVPMYLVYSPATPKEPSLLPEVLTADRLVEAFGDAATGGDDE